MDYQKINKKNISKWEDTLRYLTRILEKNNIKYYLSASGLEYILGSDTYPHDIDLFISEDSVRKIFGLLKEYAISDLHKWEDRLLEFEGEYNGIPFEICEWEKEPEELKIVIFKDFKIIIYV